MSHDAFCQIQLLHDSFFWLTSCKHVEHLLRNGLINLRPLVPMSDGVESVLTSITKCEMFWIAAQLIATSMERQFLRVAMPLYVTLQCNDVDKSLFAMNREIAIA